MTASQKENFIKRGGDFEQWQANVNKATGQNYRWMMDHVRKVLGDIRRVYPDYDKKQGVELAGFVWFQGWNDYIDTTAYPNQKDPDGYKEYTDVFVHFIRDIRKELSAPDLPFVIGVMGQKGEKADAKMINFRTHSALKVCKRSFH